MYLSNVYGDFFNNQFSNVTTPVESTGGADLGLDTPTWAGSNGARVDRYQPTSIDGNNRFVQGWDLIDGTWRNRWISTGTW